MNITRRVGFRRHAALAIMLAGAASSPRVAQGQTVVEPERLDINYVDKHVAVDGVFASSAVLGDVASIRLKNCGLRFLLAKEKFEKLPANANLHLEGVVRSQRDAKDQGDELVVAVTVYKSGPDDLQRFDDALRQMGPTQFEPRYRLAAWANERFDKYKLDGLVKRAKDAYEAAVTIERGVAAGNAAALKSFAQRLKADGRAETYDMLGLAHETLQADYQPWRAQPEPRLKELASLIRAQLAPAEPGRAEPLDAAEQVRYRDAPISTYALERERPALRSQYARLWEALIADRLNQLAFEKSAKDVRALLEQVRRSRREIADYPAFARAWAERARQAYKGSLDHFAQAEVEELAALMADELKDAGTADKMRSNWLHARQLALRRRDREAADSAQVRGLPAPVKDSVARYDLALLYLKWLPEDEDAKASAIELLREVKRLDPGNIDAESRLLKLGQRSGGAGDFVAADEAPSPGRPRTFSTAAIRVGDRGDKLRQILGEPTSVTRVVGKDWAQQFWEYDRYLYVLRESSADGSTLVDAIKEIPKSR